MNFQYNQLPSTYKDIEQRSMEFSIKVCVQNFTLILPLGYCIESLRVTKNYKNLKQKLVKMITKPNISSKILLNKLSTYALFCSITDYYINNIINYIELLKYAISKSASRDFSKYLKQHETRECMYVLLAFSHIFAACSCSCTIQVHIK